MRHRMSLHSQTYCSELHESALALMLTGSVASNKRARKPSIHLFRPHKHGRTILYFLVEITHEWYFFRANPTWATEIISWVINQANADSQTLSVTRWITNTATFQNKTRHRTTRLSSCPIGSMLHTISKKGYPDDCELRGIRSLQGNTRKLW